MKSGSGIKRSWLVMAAALTTVGATVSVVVSTQTPAPRPARPSVTVYKSPTCGCCSQWVEHMKANGFDVKALDVEDIEVPMRTYGVPSKLGSCHTAIVGGYVIEGHVPASDIQRLLEQKPAVAGLAVPGMPMGSPGMEGPRKDAYDVLSFDRQGKLEVFASH